MWFILETLKSNITQDTLSVFLHGESREGQGLVVVMISAMVSKRQGSYSTLSTGSGSPKLSLHLQERRDLDSFVFYGDLACEDHALMEDKEH